MRHIWALYIPFAWTFRSLHADALVPCLAAMLRSVSMLFGLHAEPDGNTSTRDIPTAEPKTKPEQGKKPPTHRGVTIGSWMSFISVAAAAISFPFMQTRRDALGCDALCQGGQTSLRSGLMLVGASLIGRSSDQVSSLPLALALPSPSPSPSSSPGPSPGPSPDPSPSPSPNQFGRKPMLVIGLVASLTSLAISASMDTILGMWIAIVPTALLNHNWSVLKARSFGCTHQASLTMAVLWLYYGCTMAVPTTPLLL